MSDNEEIEKESGPVPPGDEGAGEGATTPGPERTAGSISEDPAATIAALEADKADVRERMLRIAADFENYKKRARKEMADHEARARETVLRDFLEIVDNLERAVSSFGQGGEIGADAVKKGVDMVLRQFHSRLERHDVRPISSVGETFDPRIHDAVSQAPSADAPPGTVLTELQKGYHLGERLLRPALVVVAVAAPARAAAAAGTAEGEAVAPGDAAPVEEKKPA